MEYYFIAANTGLGTELGKEEIEAKIQTKLDDMTNCNVKLSIRGLRVTGSGLYSGGMIF